MNDINQLQKLNIAIVYDRLNKWGGAEQVLLELHKIFPNAPIYSAVHNKKTATWANVFPKINTSFLQHLPFAKTHHELIPFLTPLAFETFDLKSFDVVISVTSSDAKGVITQPHSLHICLCLTPTRYLWTYPPNQKNWLVRKIINYLKFWDQAASSRPDHYISISTVVKDRIKNTYFRESDLIFPPVNIDELCKFRSSGTSKGNYFIFIGRLVYHKEIDELIKTFNKLHLPLKIIGSGVMEKHLKSISNPNIEFLGQVSSQTLISVLSRSKALVTIHEEDFGLVYVEAQSLGVPIIALNRGGVKDIVDHLHTGYLANSMEEFENVLVNLSNYKFSIPPNFTDKFSSKRFHQQFAKVVFTQWKKFKATSTF
jgi:glycosyltransferase involved in cell wall biosynthesis